jgi:hypothetical protein
MSAVKMMIEIRLTMRWCFYNSILNDFAFKRYENAKSREIDSSHGLMDDCDE